MSLRRKLMLGVSPIGGAALGLGYLAFREGDNLDGYGLLQTAAVLAVLSVVTGRLIIVSHEHAETRLILDTLLEERAVERAAAMIRGAAHQATGTEGAVVIPIQHARKDPVDGHPKRR